MVHPVNAWVDLALLNSCRWTKRVRRVTAPLRYVW